MREAMGSGCVRCGRSRVAGEGRGPISPHPTMAHRLQRGLGAVLDHPGPSGNWERCISSPGFSISVFLLLGFCLLGDKELRC